MFGIKKLKEEIEALESYVKKIDKSRNVLLLRSFLVGHGISDDYDISIYNEHCENIEDMSFSVRRKQTNGSEDTIFMGDFYEVKDKLVDLKQEKLSAQIKPRKTRKAKKAKKASKKK